MKLHVFRLAALWALATLSCNSAGSDSGGTGTAPGKSGAGGTSSAKASSNATDRGGATESNSDTEAGGADTEPDDTGIGGAKHTEIVNTGGKTSASAPDGSGGTQLGSSSVKNAAGGSRVRTSSGGPKSTAAGGSAATGEPPNSSAGMASTASGGNTTSPGTGSGTSPGCGSGKTTSSCSKSGSKCTLTVNGKERTYYLQLPTNYDASKPSPVVFQFHPLGGNAEQALTMYRISAGFPNAIYITPQGLSGSSPTGGDQPGWANQGGEDIQFTLDMLEAAKTDFCVDTQRVFSMGFSYGGMMSYAIGCELGNVFRAIAPMSGATYSGCKGNKYPIAMWGAHGTQDTFVPTANGQSARDQILKQNHCGTETKPVEPSPCVAYQGCDDGYPVIWCEWEGSHAIPSFGSSAIAAFFKQF